MLARNWFRNSFTLEKIWTFQVEVVFAKWRIMSCVSGGKGAPRKKRCGPGEGRRRFPGRDPWTTRPQPFSLRMEYMILKRKSSILKTKKGWGHTQKNKIRARKPLGKAGSTVDTKYLNVFLESSCGFIKLGIYLQPLTKKSPQGDGK